MWDYTWIHGKVDFQAFYNQQNCDATIKSGTENYPGIVKNLPGYNYFFHESMWDYTFENTHKLELPCFSDNFDNYEIKYSSEGKINGENFDTRLSLSLDEFVVTSKKYAGTVVLKEPLSSAIIFHQKSNRNYQVHLTSKSLH